MSFFEIDRIDALKNSYKDDLRELSEDSLQKRPSAQRWSIAEVLDHIILLNESYYPTFRAILDGVHRPPWHGRLPLLPRLFGKMLLKAVQVSNSKKVKTFRQWEPSGEPGTNILDRFLQHQDELKGWYQNLLPYAGQGIVLASPADRRIVYSLDSTLELLLSHEARHIDQVKEVKAAIDGVSENASSGP